MLCNRQGIKTKFTDDIQGTSSVLIEYSAWELGYIIPVRYDTSALTTCKIWKLQQKNISSKSHLQMELKYNFLLDDRSYGGLSKGD